MWETFIKILESPAGSFASIAMIFGVLFFLVYKGGQVVERFKVINKFETNIDTIKTDIMEIKAFISVFRRENNEFTKRQSPISLTVLGKQVADDIKAEETTGLKWTDIEPTIKKKLNHDANPYTIQEACFELGKKYYDFLNSNELDTLKTYAYKKGYNMYDFENIFGVIIRDIYFKKNKINVVDVDKHDPNKTS